MSSEVPIKPASNSPGNGNNRDIISIDIDPLDMIQPTLMKIYEQLTSGDSIENLSFAFTPALFILAALHGGIRSWIKISVVLSFIFGGLMIFYPDFLLGITMNGELDNGLRFVCSLYGCYQIVTALFPIFFLKSKDESIFLGYFWSKLIENAMVFIDNIVSYNNGIRWNYKLICFSGLAMFTSLLFSIYFIMGIDNKRAQYNFKMFPVNRVAKVEFFILFITGLCYFGYPSGLLDMVGMRGLHEGHISIVRLSGILVLTLSIESFLMPTFLYEKDKLNFLLARMTAAVLKFLVLCHGHLYLQVLNKTPFVILSAVHIAYALFMLYGYLLCGKKLQEYKNQADLNCSRDIDISMSSHNTSITSITSTKSKLN